MHRKLIGSILYKQSYTAQGLAIKRAKFKHVFKRPVYIIFFKHELAVEAMHTRVFLKGHFVKKKMFTPPRNWGVPRKIISRRRD